MWKIKDIILLPIFGVHLIISGLKSDRFSTMCHHGMINHSEVVTHVVSSNVQKLIRRNAQTELRIHTHYDRSIKSLKNFQDIKSHTVPSRLTLDSPMAGYINFCPDTLSNEYNDKMRSLFVATHEILHSLGFSTSLFAFYRDKQNRPLTPRDPITFKPALGWYSGKNGYVFVLLKSNLSSCYSKCLREMYIHLSVLILINLLIF
ncbi:unnamed protein product [Schistosoma mattheei]|uniref:Uncharacterized protein n=1 Tax=Schistosoma mattheei TaxID=31246 RepID=A0A183PMN2_9TREM|nr:unnamed protein product [Schistosoma mattheei]